MVGGGGGGGGENELVRSQQTLLPLFDKQGLDAMVMAWLTSKKNQIYHETWWYQKQL